MAIPDAYVMNFNTMVTAAEDGNLALVECTDTKTGDPRYVITAIGRDGDEYVLVPFGHLCMDNPYYEYLPPSDAKE